MISLKHQKFRLPLLKLIQDGKMYRVNDCLHYLADELNFTEEERKELLPKSKRRTRLYDRIYWAKTHLCMSGLIEKYDSGAFRITEEGKKVSEMNLIDIDDDFLKQYTGFIEFLERSRKKVSYGSKNPQTILKGSNSTEEVYSTDDITLLNKLYSLTHQAFEDLMLDFLFNLGYGVTKESIKRNIKKTHDGGLDGYIELDVLGLDKVFIQAKKWKRTSSVGIEYTQRFSGSIDSVGGNKGIFITTSQFTPQAVANVKSIKNKSIILVDGVKLTSLIKKYNLYM